MKRPDSFAAFLLLKSFTQNSDMKPPLQLPSKGADAVLASLGRRDADLNELNPQGGSPMNTFTSSQLDELGKSLPGRVAVAANGNKEKSDQVNILDPAWSSSPYVGSEPSHTSWSGASSSLGQPEPDRDFGGRIAKVKPSWFGAPRLDSHAADGPRRFRELVRSGSFSDPTNGVCPGFLQCNLVVLPRGQHAFDFFLFCQRNKKACPLVEVCDGFSPDGVSLGADLRKDVPRYAIYKDGVLEKEVTDATDYWPEDAVAFLIGCSFSYDGALTNAGIPLRSVEQKKNVPMYRTNLKCREAGAFKGNMVVSMKPIKAMDIAKEVEITSKYPHAHGAPVCVGCPEAIGIADVTKPDWGDAVGIAADELPVFHACGVTPQAVLMDSKVPYAITHSAGHMFVTDLPSDVVV